MSRGPSAILAVIVTLSAGVAWLAAGFRADLGAWWWNWLPVAATLAGALSAARLIPERLDRWTTRAALGLGLLWTATLVIVILRQQLDWPFLADDWVWVEIARTASRDPLQIFTREISGSFRPLQHALFLMEWTLFGMWPFGYFLTCWLLAGVCAFLAVRLVRAHGVPWPVQALAGALALLPGNSIETIIWPSAQSGQLLVIFSLLALRELLGAGRPAPLLALALLMLGAKEEGFGMAALLIGVVVARKHVAWRIAAVMAGGLWLAYMLAQFRFHRDFDIMNAGLYSMGLETILKLVVSPLYAWARGFGADSVLMLAVPAVFFATEPPSPRRRLAGWGFLLTLAHQAALAPASREFMVYTGNRHHAVDEALLAVCVPVVLWALAGRFAPGRSSAVALVALFLLGRQLSLMSPTFAIYKDIALRTQEWQRAVEPHLPRLREIPEGTLVATPGGPINSVHLRSYWRLQGMTWRLTSKERVQRYGGYLFEADPWRLIPVEPVPRQ